MNNFNGISQKTISAQNIPQNVFELFKSKNRRELKPTPELIRRIEMQIIEGNVKEIFLSQILYFYEQTKKFYDAQRLLDRILCSPYRNKKYLGFAARIAIKTRQYKRAYRYYLNICYEYDRQGKALLDLAKVAYLNANYRLAINWLEEYISHNSLELSEALYWLQLCYLRNRSYRDAYYVYQKYNTGFSYNAVDWLSRIVQDGKRPPPQDWYGKKSKPLDKFIKLDWRYQILNKPLQFKAKSIADIDLWINKATYVSDERLFNTADFWQLPVDFEQNKTGDCEDFALWVWVQLLRLRINARFVIGGLFSTEINHAWVQLYLRNEIRVFECTPQQNNVSISVRNAPEYFPIFSIDGYLKTYSHFNPT